MEDIRFVHIQQSYYFSDRLSEARTQSVAGRNKIEHYYRSALHAGGAVIHVRKP